MAKPPREIELLLIKDYPSKDQAGSGSKLRVVQWVFERGFSVKLERRAYYTKDGSPRIGKAMGLGLEDFAELHARWKEVIQLMKNPPKPTPPKQETPDGEDSDGYIEEVPF